jgi:hypothetical protein
LPLTPNACSFLVCILLHVIVLAPDEDLKRFNDDDFADIYIVCTALFQSAVCSASVSHDFPLLLIRVVRRIISVVNVAK